MDMDRAAQHRRHHRRGCRHPRRAGAMTAAGSPNSVSRALRSMECNGMLRCRPGPVPNAAVEAIPDQRCTTPLRYVLHRIRETSRVYAATLTLLALALAHPASAQPKPPTRLAPPIPYMPQTEF